jgi:toxin ParE1/3/4
MQVRLTSLAQVDYFQALAWYENRQPGLGWEFELELESLYKRIEQNPESFRKATPAVRKAHMARFKHDVYFAIESNEIRVLAIYHPSRNPDALRFRF